MALEKSVEKVIKIGDVKIGKISKFTRLVTPQATYKNVIFGPKQGPKLYTYNRIQSFLE